MISKGRSGLGVHEAKKRRLESLAESSSTRTSLSVEDYRSRSRSNHEERRAEGLLKNARKTCKDLDQQKPSSLSSSFSASASGGDGREGESKTWNVLWLDPLEELAKEEERVRHSRRYKPVAKTRLGDFSSGINDDEEDEDNLLGDDQARRRAKQAGYTYHLDDNGDGKADDTEEEESGAAVKDDTEILTNEEILAREDEKEEFFEMDAKARLKRTVDYLRYQHK